MPKGKTNNPNGRPAGTKNAKTQQWEALGESIITQHADRFNSYLAKADEDDFARYFIMILEHFKPKLSRQEQKIEGNQTQTVIFKRG